MTSPGKPADGHLVRLALLAAADIGPFFRLELHERELAPGWQPARQLFRSGLGELAASTARQLGTDETRVAASILHLGFAARLWSPVLGCALLADVIPDLTSLLVSTEPPIRLGLVLPAGSGAELAYPAGWRADSVTEPDDPAGSRPQLAKLTAAAVSGLLAGLASGLPVRLAHGLLRGNSASAMAGALGELTRARPDLTASAAALASALLRTSSLAGGGRLTGPGLVFRRRSCCLYYRVADGGLCGDCCFDRQPSRGA